MARRRDALEADFRRYYGLDLADMGRGYSARHAAALCAQLPAGCRLLAPEGPPDPWAPTDYLLANIEFYLHVLCYRGTEDAKRGLNAPEPVEPPLLRARRAAADAATDPAQVAEELGIDPSRL